MKKKIFLSLFLLLAGGGVSADYQNEFGKEETYVYICTGNSSKRYHKTSKCRGLSNCKEDIIKVTIEKAIQLDRTPCKICYK